MRRLPYIVLMALVGVSAARAQNSTPPTQSNLNVAADFVNHSAIRSETIMSEGWSQPSSAARFGTVSSLALNALLEPAEAEPAAPNPTFVYGSRDDYRWQLGLGISLVRFRSSQFYATGVGTNTSVTYFTNDWFAVEGSVNTAFAPTIFKNEHVKYASYGAGPKIAWRGRKLEPWAHAIGGGMHILPQTAGHGQNGLAFQIGGGVDYRFYPHLSVRAEADWVKTHVFGEWGNSAQANVDIVLHF